MRILSRTSFSKCTVLQINGVNLEAESDFRNCFEKQLLEILEKSLKLPQYSTEWFLFITDCLSLSSLA